MQPQREPSMNAVRIRRKLESETLHLPELKPLIGKNVDIIVFEGSSTRHRDWDDAMRALAKLEDYDFEAFRRQRVYHLQHAKDHLP
jgi:hypothetical protein